MTAAQPALQSYLDDIYAARDAYDQALARRFPIGATVHLSRRHTRLEVSGAPSHGRVRVINRTTGAEYWLCATRLWEFDAALPPTSTDGGSS